MHPNQIKDSTFWRERAGQFRTLAITMNGSGAASLFGDLANDYDKIADKNERQVAAEARNVCNAPA